MATTTKTATKTQTAPETQAASEKREVAIFAPPRLPYHQALKERFEIEPSGWKALVESVFPSAKTVDSVVLALSYCKARQLDVFKKPVHIVPMWDSRAGPEGRGGYVETIWPGIGELRTTAFRTGNYGGCDETQFGAMVERTFEGKIRKGRGQNAEWEAKKIVVRFPEWARVTVYRTLNGQRCKFVGPKVLWLESYATIGKSDLPNEMWETRPEGQLEKCAEAASLRKAFPEELGNMLTADEMAGRHVIHDDTDDAPRPQTQGNSGPPAPDQVKSGAKPAAEQQPPQQQQAKPQEDVVDAEYDEVEGLPLEDPNPPKETKSPPTQPDGFSEDEKVWLRELEGALSRCNSYPALGEVQKQDMAPKKRDVSTQAWAKAQFFVEDAFKRIQREIEEAASE